MVGVYSPILEDQYAKNPMEADNTGKILEQEQLREERQAHTSFKKSINPN